MLLGFVRADLNGLLLLLSSLFVTVVVVVVVVVFFVVVVVAVAVEMQIETGCFVSSNTS